MDYNEIDVNAVCFGILCNFQQFCGEERAKEASALVRQIYEENKKLLDRAESAEARAETLEKMVKEYQEVIVPGYREKAEKAERERDEAFGAICTHCGDFPCQREKCPWWRGEKT